MLAFDLVREKQLTLQALVAGLTVDDLRTLTNEMIDSMLAKLAGVEDADVLFVPEDAAAEDTFATDAADANMAWTLGHVVVHVTASAEESAALAAELARGVENHGRSRYETPWEEMQTVAQCRQRLEESRRMRLASLAMWPDRPHLENTYVPWKSLGEVDAVGRFVLGLRHDWDHLEQMDEIVRQARAIRAVPVY